MTAMVASRSARIMLLVLGASLVALAIACGSFGADAPPGPNDASTDVDTAADVASPVDSGVGACGPEPVWANADTPDSGVPTTATCAGIEGVDLLTTPMHCGRCGHSCGGDECERGYCVPRETAGG